jgi:hypothetical protein
MGGAVSAITDAVSDVGGAVGDVVGGVANGVGDALGGVGDTIKNNAGLIGTGVGTYFGMPALGGMIGGAIQGGPQRSGVTGTAGGGGAGAGTAGAGGPFPWAQTGFALQDMYGKQQAAKALQDRFNQVNTQINSMYAPGSPEANAMKQEMERKDAAAGRNSQYGTRAVDLAGKIAATKGNLLSQTLGNQNNLLAAGLATGNSAYGSLANMYGQNSNASSGVNNAISSGISGLSNLFGGGNNLDWTTGTDVLPTSTFEGGGTDLLSSDMQALLGL